MAATTIQGFVVVRTAVTAAVRPPAEAVTADVILRVVSPPIVVLYKINKKMLFFSFNWYIAAAASTNSFVEIREALVQGRLFLF